MPPPSPLAISTASVQRLLKEEATYRTELASQETRLKKLERDDGDEDGNREWTLRQEKQAIQETKAVFGPLREKILGAVEGLEGVLESSEGAQYEEKDLVAARELVVRARDSRT